MPRYISGENKEEKGNDYVDQVVVLRTFRTCKHSTMKAQVNLVEYLKPRTVQGSTSTRLMYRGNEAIGGEQKSLLAVLGQQLLSTHEGENSDAF